MSECECSLRELDKAYIAGFFDGEGYVGIVPRSRSSGWVLQVSISQINPAPLEYIKKFFGGYLQLLYPKNRSPIFRWAVSANKALSFLVAIEPYLIHKKDQASICIEFQRYRSIRGKNLTKSENATHAALASSVRDLNALFKLKRAV